MHNEVLTLGTFDLFHEGHALFLQACRDIGHVTVGLNSSEYAASFKQPPVLSTEERAAVLHNSASVVGVRINNGNCKKLIETWVKYINPGMSRFLVIGEDWAPSERYLKQLDITMGFLRQHGIKLIFLVSQSTLHTTEIRERCQKQP